MFHALLLNAPPPKLTPLYGALVYVCTLGGFCAASVLFIARAGVVMIPISAIAVIIAFNCMRIPKLVVEKF